MTAFAFLATLVVLFGLGIYVAVAMGLGSLFLVTVFGDRTVWDIYGYIPWNTLTSFTLVALPLFVLMGEVLLRSGSADRMYDALAKWLTGLPGGLLHTNVAACAMFACVSGSSAATAATIGRVSLPFMKKYRYSERVAVGSLVSGGTLGILIPPSIAFIIYGVLVEESIGHLYLAGMFPGLLLTGLFMALILAMAIARPGIAPSLPGASWRERFAALWDLVPIAVLMLIVLGTIYAGIATATEAAAFGVSGSFVIALINRRVDAKMLREVFLAAAGTTSMILFILIGAFVLQFVLAFLGMPAALTRLVTGLGLGPLEFVLAICVLYLVLGTFMEELSMVVTTIPIFLPVLKALHVDLVWFGVIVVMLIQASIVSPPVGMNLFVIQSLRKQLAARGEKPPIKDVFIGVLPFFGAIVVTLALVIAFPQIALWLPTSAK
ncbi:MAG: TRAP transporter large permease subunit [Burkholderiales bacterium]|nr:TRAP transporter large permease subunit [Burkholderiales bacterium]